MSHELLHPESVKDADKTVSFCTLSKKRVTYPLYATLVDLGRMAAQLRAAGIEVDIDPQSYPNGRFARVHDPEGNPVEWWQPAVRDAPR